jgi:hypothetical protein
VATTAAIVVIALVTLSALSVLFALREWPQHSAIALAALTFASVMLLLGWRHASAVFPYLRSGDRDLLFSDYPRRLSALEWISSVLRLSAIALLGFYALPYFISGLAFYPYLEMIIGFVPEGGDFLEEFPWETFTGLLVLSFLCRIAQRYFAPRAAAALLKDSRRPILLLRSFKDENVRILAGSMPIVIANAPLVVPVPRRLDEFLADSLRSFGPVIAIGRPKELLPSLGAAREYASDDNWASLVERRICEAQIVIAMLGGTEGFAWEMSAIPRLSAKQKLILVVPPLRTAHQIAERWETISKALDVESKLPIHPVVVSWNDDSVNVHTAGPFHRQADGYRIALARVLKQSGILSTMWNPPLDTLELAYSDEVGRRFRAKVIAYSD